MKRYVPSDNYDDLHKAHARIYFRNRPGHPTDRSIFKVTLHGNGAGLIVTLSNLAQGRNFLGGVIVDAKGLGERRSYSICRFGRNGGEMQQKRTPFK
jgi:hypothetical protein